MNGPDQEVLEPLAVREEQRPPEAWTPRFVTTVDEAVAMVEEKREFFRRVMKDGVHYGIIPGTDKPSLWKPGAELLTSRMGMNPVCTNESEPILDVTGADHGGEPFIFYQRTCRIYRRDPRTGEEFVVAQAGGSCNSWESKYRYRNDKLKCPECGKATIIKAKDFSGQGRDLGWVCWKKEGKSDGCGVAFPAGDPKIAGQVVGKITNPDVAELVNTIEKMADKRALVAATLLATGCSDIFTQDMEEDKEPAPEDSSAKTATEPPSRPVPRPQPAAPPRKPPVPPPAPPAHPEPELPPEGTGPSPAQRKQLFALADELQMDERARHQFGEIQFRKPSSKTWTKDEVSRAIDVLSRRLDARNAQEAAQ